MLTLTGRLIDVVRSENTDRSTGQITQVVAAEILHKERGKSVVESLKFDLACESGWRKAIGKEVAVEVRVYAMSGSGGSVNSGLSLADKKAYPTLAHAEPALKAA